MKMKVTLFLLSCLYVVKSFGQQEPIYSQYMFNTLAINPAYAGSHEVVGATILYRNQWMGVPGAPKTTMAGIDIPDNVNGLGYGLQINNDQIGIQSTNTIVGSLSYRVHLFSEEDELSTGIQLGMANYQANFGSVDLIQKFDPSFTGVYINKWLPDAGAGLFYHNDKFFLGISAPSVLNTYVGVSQFAIQRSAASGFSTPHYFLNSGYLFNLNEDLVLKPSILVKAVSGAPMNVDFNTNLYYRDLISIGASYRSNASVVGMIQLRLNEQWQVGYAYDRDITNIKLYSMGTNEIMFRYEMKPIKNLLHPRNLGHSIYF
jgi:type IX secretion system PorP/SprF family membrane protein